MTRVVRGQTASRGSRPTQFRVRLGSVSRPIHNPAIGERAKRKGGRGEEGAVAVEMALTLQAFLFLLLGTMQAGLVFWNWNTMLLAVEEAGRYAMLYNPNTLQKMGVALAQVCPNGVTTVTLGNCAVAWANQNLGSNFAITSSNGTDSNGNTTWTFTATYTFNFLTSFTLSRAIQVSAV
jgi:Flp pilus assembly protein TadG